MPGLTEELKFRRSEAGVEEEMMDGAESGPPSPEGEGSILEDQEPQSSKSGEMTISSFEGRSISYSALR